MFRRNNDLQDLNAVEAILQKRAEVIATTVQGIERAATVAKVTLSGDELFFLASGEMFVEKAQRVLSGRSNGLIWGGIVCSVFALAALVAAAVAAFDILHDGRNNGNAGHTDVLVANFLTSLGLAGVVFVGVRFLITLARSFFHESHVLRDRRDLFRFGRMALYGSRGHATPEELQAMFQWHATQQTSFLDWRPEHLTATPLGDAFKAIGELPEATALLLASMANAPRKRRRWWPL